jgi:hypothetical protein
MMSLNGSPLGVTNSSRVTIGKSKLGKTAATVAVEMPDGAFLNLANGEDTVVVVSKLFPLHFADKLNGFVPMCRTT